MTGSFDANFVTARAAGSSAGAASIAKLEAAKLNFGLHNWTQEELKVVAEVLEDSHLAGARTIWMRLLRQLPDTKKRPRDIETLLERIAKYTCRSRPSDASSLTAAVDADSANSMDAFLCLLDDLVPGGLDFSTELADIIIESASKASGQLAEVYLFLASLIDGRPNSGLNRLSSSTCRRLLSMLTNLLPAARSATEQTDYLYRLLGLAHTSASLPRATVFRDRLQSLLKMPLSTRTEPPGSSGAGNSVATPFETWLRNRFAILEDYAAYSINPLNLPDDLLVKFPGSSSTEEFQLANAGQEAGEDFMQRYLSSRASLSRELQVRVFCESESDDEKLYKRLATKVVVATSTAQQRKCQGKKKAIRKPNSATAKRKPANNRTVRLQSGQSASKRGRKRQRNDSKFNVESESEAHVLPGEDSILSLDGSADSPLVRQSKLRRVPTVQPPKRIKKQIEPSDQRRQTSSDCRSSGVEISTAEQRLTEPQVQVDQVTIVDLNLKTVTLPGTLPAQYLAEDSEPVAADVSCIDGTASMSTRTVTSTATPMATTIAKSAATSRQSLPSAVPKTSQAANQSMDNSSASGKENGTKVTKVLVDPFKVNLKKFFPERTTRYNKVDSNAPVNSNYKSPRKIIYPIAAQQQQPSKTTTPKAAASASKPITDEQQRLQRELLSSKPQMRRGRTLTYVGDNTRAGELSSVRNMLHGGFVKRIGPEVILFTTPTRHRLATVATSASDANSTTTVVNVAKPGVD